MATTILLQAVNSTATTLNIADGTGFAVNGGVVTVESEQIQYVTASDNQLHGCVRGFNSTSAASHAHGTTVTFNTVTPETNVDFEGAELLNVADPAHTQSAATKNYVDINAGAHQDLGNVSTLADSLALTAPTNLQIGAAAVSTSWLEDNTSSSVQSFTANTHGDNDQFFIETNVVLMNAHASDGIRVAIGDNLPDSKAVLDVQSVTKGFLPPRMTTTQRDAISTPPEGLTIYNLTTHTLNFWNGSAWTAV